MRREDTLQVLLESRVIAVIRMTDPEKVLRTVEAVARGGVRAVEITMTTPGALGTIRSLAAAKGSAAIIGAGTVLDAGTAEEVIEAGAEFVVSPVTDPDMIRVCRRRDVLVAPGAFSPTEIVNAWRLGADLVKVFPATSLGPQFFRDLRGPLPQIRLMPTGGVSVENARSFIAAGASCVAVGTALLDKPLIAGERWDDLAARARALVDSLRN